MNDDLETVFPLPVWAVILIFILCWPSIVLSAPRFAASEGATTVTLYDEPCELKEVVTNLPYKATWVEGDKIIQGCWGAWVNDQRVLAYFGDKTVALIPFSVLSKVQGV